MNALGQFPLTDATDSPLAVRGMSATYDGKPALPNGRPEVTR